MQATHIYTRSPLALAFHENCFVHISETPEKRSINLTIGAKLTVAKLETLGNLG